MPKFTITLCQFAPLWQNPQSSCQLLAEQIADIPSTDLLILPEMFASGFSMQPELFSKLFSVSDFLQNFAKQRQQNIIAGVVEERDGYFENNALALQKNGEILGRYTKQRCFTYAGEGQVYQSGQHSAMVDIGGIKAALFICYDLRFPELFRAVAQQVEVMVVIANWPQSRQTHWQALLIARAIENQCFIIGANRTGEDGNDLHYVGGSMVVDPNGEVLLQMEDELFAEIEIDTEKVTQQRQRFAFLQDI